MLEVGSKNLCLKCNVPIQGLRENVNQSLKIYLREQFVICDACIDFLLDNPALQLLVRMDNST